MLVQGSPHIPEVQIVPWQQAGGKERLTQQERDLEIRVRSRTKTSEDSSEKKHRSQVAFICSLTQSTKKCARSAPAREDRDEKQKQAPPSGMLNGRGTGEAGTVLVEDDRL